MQTNYTQKYIDIFWGRVAKTDDPNDCWLWTAGQGGTGYGLMVFGYYGKKVSSHRAAYEITFGEIPEGLLVCHKCDVRLCCNPSHLFLGTYQDNSDDKLSKGRQSHTGPRGENHGKHKLTDEQVLEIRQRYDSGKEDVKTIAKDYSVCYQQVWKIATRKNWKP